MATFLELLGILFVVICLGFFCFILGAWNIWFGIFMAGVFTYLMFRILKDIGM